MSDPKRLLDGGGDDQAAEALLRALPPPLAPSAAKQAELVRQLGELSAASAASTAGVFGAGWLKLALLGGACLTGGVWIYQGSSSRLSPVATANSPSARPPSPRAEPASARAARLPTPVSSSQPLPRPGPAAAANRRAPRRDSLADEEALLEQARRRLADAPGATLSLLQEHQRRFPSGQLTAERLYLRVEALSRSGNRAAAEQQTEALIRAYPTSVYAAQLKARRAAAAR